MEREAIEIVEADQREESSDAVDRIIEDAVAIGATWAHHGLTLGKLVLEAEATTFRKAARILETLADRFAPEPDAPPEG